MARNDDDGMGSVRAIGPIGSVQWGDEYGLFAREPAVLRGRPVLAVG